VAEKRQRLTEFCDLIDEICEKKNYKNSKWKCFRARQVSRKRQTLGGTLGGVKKIAAEVYPLAIFDQPVDPDQVWR
jgi:hypothetical protein